MENIEKHIEIDKRILEDPTTSLNKDDTSKKIRELEVYVKNHQAEIVSPGDHHDPSPLELYCEVEPGGS